MVSVEPSYVKLPMFTSVSPFSFNSVINSTVTNHNILIISPRFISGNDYSSLFKEEDIKEGDIVDEKGHVLGKHRGIIHYTLGQRRGLGIASPPFLKHDRHFAHPLSVCRHIPQLQTARQRLCSEQVKGAPPHATLLLNAPATGNGTVANTQAALQKSVSWHSRTVP